MTYSQLFT